MSALPSTIERSVPSAARAGTRPVRPALRVAAGVALVVVVGYLLVGITSAARPFDAHDFRHSWTAGEAFLRGQDPYVDENLRAIWAEDPVPGAEPGTPNYRFLNPPGYSVVMAPLALLRFEIAALIFAIVSVAVYVAGLVAIGRTVARDWPRWARVVGGLAAFGAAPVWAAVQAGQSSLLVFGALALAFAALERDRHGWAGVLLGLATVKFTIGLLVLPYLLLRGHRRVVAIALGVAATMTAIALASFGPGAIGSYLAALADTQAEGGVNWVFGPATGNDLSLYPLFARIATAENQQLATALYELSLIACALGLWMVVRARRTVSALDLAAVMIASQIIVYHRAYDAVVFVFAAAALLASDVVRRNRIALAVTLGTSFLLANVHAPLARGSGSTAWLWDVVVLSHRTWALIGLFGVTCWAAVRSATAERVAVPLPERTVARRREAARATA